MHQTEAENDAEVIVPPPPELEQLPPARSCSSSGTAVTELPGEPYFAEYVQEIQDSSDAGTDTNASVLSGSRDRTQRNTIVVPSHVNEQMTDDSVTSSDSTRCDSISDSTESDGSMSGNQDDHDHGSLTTDTRLLSIWDVDDNMSPLWNQAQQHDFTTDHDSNQDNNAGFTNTGQDGGLTKYPYTGLLSIWDVDDMPLLRNKKQVQQQQHGKGVNCELHSVKTSRSERENSNGFVQKSDASGTNSYVRSRKRGHREVKRPQNGKYDPSVSRDGKTAGPDLVQWCPVSPRYDISLYEFKIFRSFV